MIEVTIHHTLEFDNPFVRVSGSYAFFKEVVHIGYTLAISFGNYTLLYPQSAN